VRKIQPVDMFPHTDHVETVVLLKKIWFFGELGLLPNPPKFKIISFRKYFFAWLSSPVCHLVVQKLRPIG
jgi:hypothetical protein